MDEKEDKWAKFRNKGNGDQYEKAQEGAKKAGEMPAFVTNAYKYLTGESKKKKQQEDE